MTGDASGLFGELFVDREMASAMSDRVLLHGMLGFQAMLASALEAEAVAPEGTAEVVIRQCDPDLYDIAELGRAATLAGNPAIPLVKAMTARVAAVSPDHAKWVHYGATSQDVIDSGYVHVIGCGLKVVDHRLDRLTHALRALLEPHRTTPMIGRTFLQQAVPITFGMKVALWLAPLLESRHVLRDILAAPVVQLAGAAGTLAALGDDGDRVQARFVALTQGADPSQIPWHGQRHRIARLAAELGILTGNLGKIARDVGLMAQTEIGELAEPEAPGKGGSSAMPHKRNPVLCTLILAAAQRTPGLVATMLAALPHEHERALGGWHAEWPTLPELFRSAGSALAQAITLIEGLQVFPERMRANIDLTHGLVMSERVSLALAAALGKAEAHHLLEQASRASVASGRHLRDLLAEDATVSARLSPAELDALFDPATYRGASDAIIDRIIAAYETEREFMSGHA
ncbi:3-carboxy-cis,cis-muconate cycloisomerase [Bosea sp. (in: a-proteobacteria)]|uniref:3-carboxy-cis,cis-muconate cycloisomerase n=1 Tax=Bosea sp. (in: a-proteobacteria) TaxID=1871050 RepID=UPI0027344E54|nr:3-carboxy-cis,cis-muconate cycloisomerase [Bosea sp. (in: a-proteobacteria)]MDP3257966.1 3-carboxy-cis,cis-muconate cycloisomerase [Bosea sp. (in: a-proteobacteria)]